MHRHRILNWLRITPGHRHRDGDAALAAGGKNAAVAFQ
jgi:hypothetical protein